MFVLFSIPSNARRCALAITFLHIRNPLPFVVYINLTKIDGSRKDKVSHFD